MLSVDEWMWEAVHEGNAEELRFALSKGANPDWAGGAQGWRALMRAAHRGSVECLQILLAAGACPHRPTDGSRDTPLMFACDGAQRACAEALLAAGARVDDRASNGGSALHTAAFVGSVGCVEALLLAGADPNLQDEDGEGALMKATLQREERCCRLLILAGADARALNKKGSSPWGEAQGDISLETLFAKALAEREAMELAASVGRQAARAKSSPRV